VDNEQLYAWLTFEDIKGEHKTTIVAANNQTISTKYLKTEF